LVIYQYHFIERNNFLERELISVRSENQALKSQLSDKSPVTPAEPITHLQDQINSLTRQFSNLSVSVQSLQSSVSPFHPDQLSFLEQENECLKSQLTYMLSRFPAAPASPPQTPG
jgi:hypothetical protein